MELLTKRGSLFVCHHAELDDDVLDPVERTNGILHPIVDFSSKRATGDGEVDGHRDVGWGKVDPTHHVQFHDAAVQFWILDWSKCFDHRILGQSHAR